MSWLNPPGTEVPGYLHRVPPGRKMGQLESPPLRGRRKPHFPGVADSLLRSSAADVGGQDLPEGHAAVGAVNLHLPKLFRSDHEDAMEPGRTTEEADLGGMHDRWH